MKIEQYQSWLHIGAARHSLQHLLACTSAPNGAHYSTYWLAHRRCSAITTALTGLHIGAARHSLYHLLACTSVPHGTHYSTYWLAHRCRTALTIALTGLHIGATRQSLQHLLACTSVPHGTHYGTYMACVVRGRTKLKLTLPVRLRHAMPCRNGAGSNVGCKERRLVREVGWESRCGR